MGPIGRTKHRGQRAGAIDNPMIEAKPGDVIAHARFHGIHEPWPAMAGVRGSHRKPCRVERITKRIDRSRQADRALARQRHPHGGARLRFAVGPQRIVDDADAATFSQNGKLGSQACHWRRPQEPCRGRDCGAPFSFFGQGFDFGRQQTRDRPALQSRERPGGQGRGLPTVWGGKRFENCHGNGPQVKNIGRMHKINDKDSNNKGYFIT